MKVKKCPIYGKGLNKREWPYVSDCARAVFLVLRKGKVGEVYNVGSGTEKKNIDLAKKILKYIDKPESLIHFVKDRLGHGFRYCLDSSKIKKLGWKSEVNFDRGIKHTSLKCQYERFDPITSYKGSRLKYKQIATRPLKEKPKPKPKLRKIYRPSPEHPWRNALDGKLMLEKAHLQNKKASEELVLTEA